MPPLWGLCYKYLMKTNTPIKGIDSKVLYRYLEARKVIDERADRISNVSRMLSLLEYCGDDTVPVSGHALAFFSDMINSDVCKIIESLDDFIYILDAESVLNKSET